MRTDRKFLFRTVALLTGLIACAGCGQKGPLRLPDAPPEAAESSATAQPAPAEDPTTLSARRSNPHE